MGGWEIGEGVGWAERGLWDYLDAGLPVAKSAHNPYTTVGALVGGRGCASRKPLLLCLPLITCRFYEKVRIANANRFRISAASAAPPNPIFR